jgi:putative endonuclease
MRIFSRMIFGVVRWAARKGLRGESAEAREDAEDGIVDAEELENAMRMAARQEGMRGETYAYWYLRCAGYVFIARNFSPRAAKGEIDLIGYDGETLAFVEVRTRTVREGDLSGLPELSVTTDKQRNVVRTALRFLGERHVKECPCRFDVVAIDNRMGKPPELRLHKDAFSPQLKGW